MERLFRGGTVAQRVALILILMSAIFASVSLFGQGAVDGRIVGVVHDPTGAVIPNAMVTVTSDATGAKFNLKTGSDGGFLVPNLNAGTYSAFQNRPLQS